MKSSKLMTRQIAIAVIGLIAAMLCVNWLIGIVCTNTMYYSEYDGVTFEGVSRGEYHMLFFGYSENDKIADIFVRFPDGEVFRLPELPEEVVAKHCDSVSTRRVADRETFIVPPDESGDSAYTTPSGFTRFIFRNGRLSRGSLRLTDITIGNRQNGPFFYLPIKQRDLESTFGEPQATHTSRSPVSWH